MPSPLLVFLACAPLGAMAAFHHLSKPPISPRIPKSGGEKRDGRPKPLSLVDPPSIDPFFNRTRVLPLRVRLCMVRSPRPALRPSGRPGARPGSHALTTPAPVSAHPSQSVMAVTVFPLRLLAMVVCLLSIAVICQCAAGPVSRRLELAPDPLPLPRPPPSISILGMDEASLKKPLPRWRRKLREPVYPAMRLFWWLLGFTNIHVKGRPAPTKTTPIVIANHQSLVDTMLLPILRATPVSKIENRRMPVVGTIGHAMQVLFVDRSSAASRAETMRALRQRATDPTFPRTLLFPEGTCTNGSVLARFKRGAFTPGCVPTGPHCLSTRAPLTPAPPASPCNRSLSSTRSQLATPRSCARAPGSAASCSASAARCTTPSPYAAAAASTHALALTRCSPPPRWSFCRPTSPLPPSAMMPSCLRPTCGR